MTARAMLALVFAALLLAAAAAPPASAQEAASGAEADATEDPLAEAFLRLASEDPAVSARARREIAEAWRESGSASIDLLVLRGERAIAREDWKTAERHLTQVVNLEPEFAMGWVLRAGVRFRADEIGLALGDAAEALAIEPRQYEALLLTALIYVQLDEKEEALAAAREALEINPHLEEARQIILRLEPEVEGVEA